MAALLDLVRKLIDYGKELAATPPRTPTSAVALSAPGI
jgi:hypothetical protein